MAGELFCPDCGGVIGAAATTDAGPPCNCFPTNTDVSKSDTAVDMPAPVAEQPKLCVVCGKDVTGHRRLKDSRGYVCYDCAKEEQKQERGDRVRCRSCGRLVKIEALNLLDGKKICNQCFSEQRTLQKKQIKKIGIETARVRTEKSEIYKWLIVAGLLLLIILFSLLRRGH